MPCTAESLIKGATCFACLSTKQLAAIDIYLKCALLNGITVTCNAESLLAAAVAAGFDKLSEKQQMAVSVSLDCQIAGGGGGGGATNNLSCGNYGGGPPNFTPGTVCALALDTSNGAVWYYYNGSWH